VSGLALAVFLPLHFLVLGSALNGAAALDATLQWTEGPLVKASEVALVFLLAAHLGGGLRLLFVEFGGWRAAWQPALIAAALGGATACALLFALNLA
jgi:fumarate reductase subunit D